MDNLTLLSVVAAILQRDASTHPAIAVTDAIDLIAEANHALRRGYLDAACAPRPYAIDQMPSKEHLA